MTKFTLKHSEWHYGTRVYPDTHYRNADYSRSDGTLHVISALRTKAGTYCCLGAIACQVHGVSDDALSGQGAPNNLRNLIVYRGYELPQPVLESLQQYFAATTVHLDIGTDDNNELTYAAMAVNDAKSWLNLYRRATRIPAIDDYCDKKLHEAGSYSTFIAIPITVADRIAMLTPILAEMGYELEFIDDMPL
jgi:hypothetical protein